ncbi:MAG: hypothetical protein ABI467_04720 [Kofleriaceae bacterium]
MPYRTLALVTAALLAACGAPSDPSDHYDGTLTIHPHGSMYSPTIAASVTISTSAMDAGGCTITRQPNDDGTLAFACSGGCVCADPADHVVTASATVAGTMLTAHWSIISADDELTTS